MPTILLNDDTKKKVNYGQASQLNQYLNDPEKLNDIRCDKCKDREKPQCASCSATRKEKELFLSRVVNIDWSDIAPKPKQTFRRKKFERDEKLHEIMADKTVKGYKKFLAIGQRLKQQNKMS